MKTPEQKIQEAMNSLNGIVRAQAPQEFAGRVIMQLSAVGRKRYLVPWPKVWLAAAGLLLLLSINIYIVSVQQAPGRAIAQQGDIRQFSNSYFDQDGGFGLSTLH